ncbi:hypothetical protein HGRIS_003559 [Hohenbuehelia grisea]|uniref:C2 domain-containing protein n=1 Tax=Hohenbuehelia grisea TaxID=104357 RepID=A0ABR3JFP6_9AGAR
MSKEIGTLIIVVLKAKNLNDKHSFYKQDVFAQITLNGSSQRTPIEVKGGQHPVWDAELRFAVMKDTAEKFRKLKVSCWSKEPRTEDILGEGTIDIADTLKSGEFDDWVPLSTEAGQRGEVYLEMTYYANAPAPTSGQLAVPSGSNLMRRPSKLSPNDRLARLEQTYTALPSSSSNGRVSQQPNNPRPAPASGQHLGASTYSSRPSSSRSSSGSPHGRDSALPPLPEDSGRNTVPKPIPTTLVPGAGRKPSAQPSSSPQLPSILRPGGPQSSSTPLILPQQNAPDRDPRVSQPIGTPPYQYTVPPQVRGYSPAPVAVNTDYINRPVSQASSGYTSPSLPSFVPPAPFAGPDPWRTDVSVVSFPVPSVAAAPEISYNSVGRGHQPPEPIRASYQHHLANDMPDPYRQARYQTPLPLPPDTTPSKPQPVPENKAADDRIIALRLAEEKAARRREQEERDAEFARQLDRELNI